MITKRSHFNLSANLSLHGWTIFGALCVFLFSTLFTSCFSDLKTSKKTTVTFNMSRQTVQKILGNIESLPAPAARSGDDPFDPDNPTSTTYIDVTLYAVEKQTKTAVVSSKSDLSMEFEEVPVGASVYAKAKIYRYTDSQKTIRDVVYNGESSRIVVRDGVNTLNLKLAGAVLTVTFNSNGGTSVSSKKVQTGSTIEKPKDPVKPAKKEKYSRYDNYAFEGWYTDPELTKGFDFSSPVTDDVTLYAKWLNDFVYVEGDVVSDYLADGRNITIGNLFVSDHEVTQAEYYAVTNNNPSQNNSYGDDLPVEQVSWFDAIKYCNLLSIREGLTPCYKVNNSTIPSEWGSLSSDTQVACNLNARGYRLPTEAEWEYIATKAERNKDLGSMAIYSANSQGRTQKIKRRFADELYLCDLLGNVAEWCFDVYSTSITSATGKTGPVVVSGTDNQRVVRGGAYNSPASECSKDARSYSNPTIASNSIGFRVVRSAIDEFAVITNTVTFLTNGGSAVATQYIMEGETASQPDNPTKTGYNFEGWLYNGSTFYFTTIIAQDIVLEAQWTPITYTVEFNQGLANSTQSTYSQTFTYDVPQELRENSFTDTEGYKFAGWSRTVPPEKPLNDVDSYRDFVDKQLVTNLSSVQDDVITLYAIWIEGARSTITYVLDNYDTSTLTPKTYVPNDTITLPVADESSGRLIRTGYTFGGWYTTETCVSGTEITGWGVNGRSGDITIYGKWIANQYTIQYFNIDGCTWASGYTKPTSYTIEDSVSLPTDSQISKQGYNFEGWYDSDDESTANRVYDWYADDHKTGEVKLYARWSPGAATYKVEHYLQKLNSDNITGSTEYQLDSTDYGVSGITGQTTNALDKKKTIAGYTYDHVENVTIAPDNSSVAKVYYKRNTITYVFRKNSNETWTDGTTEQTIVKSGLYGAEFTAPEIEKPGYSFTNWKSDGTALTGNTFGAEDKTFTAYWTTVNYSLTIHLNGGKLNGSTANYEDQLNIVDNNYLNLTDTEFIPTSNNYTFAGYYTDANFTQAAPDVINLSNNNGHLHDWDLYAKWTYTITFNTNGGSTVAPIADVLYTQAASAPTGPTKEGYDFGGWYTDSGLTTSYNFTNSASTGNVILYAMWTVHNYNITYHYDGATMSGSNPATYSINSNADLTVDPVKTGYIFAGWFLDEEATGSKIVSVTKTSAGGVYKDVDLYAYFTNSIYVSSTGDSSYTGLTPGNPVNSVAAAVNKIVSLNKGSNFDWNIAIIGTVTGTQTIENSSLTTSVAKSVTLTGYGTDATLDAQGSGGSTLTVNTAFPITITNLTITGGRGTNVSGATYGGGLYINSTSTVSLGDGVKISGNGATYGGGVYVSGNSKLYMYGTAVVGDISKNPPISMTSVPSGSSSGWDCANYASSNSCGGGGIRVDGYACLGYSRYEQESDNDEKELFGGVYGNWSGQGGGVAVSSSGYLFMKTGNISKNTGNSGTTGGGGIFSVGVVYIRGGYITDNKAGSGGGGFYLYDANSIFSLSGGEITGNKCSATGNGAAGYIMPGTFTMSGGTISGNQPLNGSGPDSGAIAVFANTSVVEITGGTIENNLDKDGNYACALYVYAASSFILGENAVIDYTTSNNNYIYTGKTITVSTPVNKSYSVKWYTTPSTATQIVTGDTTSYQKFTLLNDGWSIDTSTGKAAPN